MNITVSAKVVLTPPPPNVTPGWAANPNPPPNNPGALGATAAPSKEVPPNRATVFESVYGVSTMENEDV